MPKPDNALRRQILLDDDDEEDLAPTPSRQQAALVEEEDDEEENLTLDDPDAEDDEEEPAPPPAKPPVAEKPRRGRPPKTETARPEPSGQSVEEARTEAVRRLQQKSEPLGEVPSNVIVGTNVGGDTNVGGGTLKQMIHDAVRDALDDRDKLTVPGKLLYATNDYPLREARISINFDGTIEQFLEIAEKLTNRSS